VLRIGELSRRSGVSPELLRAWERRYRLLRPQRSPGGLRLYTRGDLERVEAMRRHLTAGVAAAEAAALALRGGDGAVDAGPPLADVAAELASAFGAFDEARAHAALDALFATASLDAALSGAIVPYLHELGERWASGDASIAEEHFASAVLRARLLALARGWGRGLGPRVVLACAPGELHELGLIAFGLALRARGWRIVYLGADTPPESVLEAARMAEPRFVVVAAVDPDAFRAHADEFRALASSHAVCLAGQGAAGAARELELLRLDGDPVGEAERLTRAAAAPD
jgi:MerR family transcriptional regulator, light-induced transcriptional regulator